MRCRLIPWCDLRGVSAWSSIRLGAGLLLYTLVTLPATRADELAIPIDPGTPSFAGLAFGAYPDYFGSDDQALGAAPLLRIKLSGERFLRVLGNEVRINLLEHTGWRLGPSAIWRLGRKDVDDKVVREVHEIDSSLDLGLFGGYAWRDAAEPRSQAGIQGWATADVTGAYDGWTAGLGVYLMRPVARAVTLAAGAASTYGSGNYMDTYFGVTAADSVASGLPAYSAGGGLRDVRGWVVATVHLGPRWHVGAGALYTRLLGDAADSPIVEERGNADQWIYGAGVLYGW